MGVQAILIFLHHFSETCMQNSVHSTGLIYYFYTYIGSSGVDVFLLLSGVGLYFSWSKQPDYKIFLKKRFLRILPAYFILAVPTWFWVDIIINKSGATAFLQDLFFVTFFTDGTMTYWYVLMMAVCYLIFPFFYKIVKESKDRVTELMCVLTICSSFTLFTVMLQLYRSSLYENINMALFRFPVFILGILLGKYVYEKRRIPKHYIYVLLGITIFLLGPLEFYNVRILAFYIRALLNISLCLLLVLFFEFISKKRNRFCAVGYQAVVKVLNCLGSYTYEIYLTHLSARKIMLLLGYKVCYLRYTLVWILITLVLSVVLKKCTAGIQRLFR